MNRMVFLEERHEEVAYTQLRLLRRPVERMMRGYPQLRQFVQAETEHYDSKRPDDFDWTYTPPGVDGWTFLERLALPKNLLKDLWDEEAVEVQTLRHGEWENAFSV